MKVRYALLSISISYTSHHNNISPGNKIQMQLAYEKPAEQLHYLMKMWVSLLLHIFDECIEKLILRISQHHHFIVKISRV